MYKSVLVCAQALLIQSVFSACAGIGAGCGGWSVNNAGLGYNSMAGYGLGAGAGCGVASTGGGLPISSVSSLAPIGLSVLSENTYQGTLVVSGSLPFLGTVALEGILPTGGAGAVSYGCGNGAVGIAAEEGPIVTGITAPGSYGSGVGAVGGLGCGLGSAGYGAGIGGIGYGAGVGGNGYGLGGIGNGYGCGGRY